MDKSTATSSPAAPETSMGLFHPFVVAILTGIYAQVMMVLLLFAALMNVVLLVCLVVSVPVAYLIGIAFVSRWTTGHFYWWWSVIITATLGGLSVFLGTGDRTIPGLGTLPAPPLILAVGAGLASMVALRRVWRLLGIVAIAAQLAIVAGPLISNQIQAHEHRAAEDAKELERRSETTVRPYVVPGYVVRIVTPMGSETDVRFSSDPEVSTRDEYTPDPSDYTISTSAVVAGESTQSEACGSILNPDTGGSPSNSCDQLNDNTWSLTSAKERSLVRIQNGSRMEITGGRADVGEFTEMLDIAEPMNDGDFDDWILWIFERDKRA